MRSRTGSKEYEEVRELLLNYQVDLSDDEDTCYIPRPKLSDEESFIDESGNESSSSISYNDINNDNPEAQESASVVRDKLYEQQDSNRESSSETDNSWCPSSSNFGDKSSSDKGSVYSLPEQNSGNSLEQVSNSSERIDSHQKEDEIYRQQDSNRKSNSEESGSRSNSSGSQEVEHTASIEQSGNENDESEKSSAGNKSSDEMEVSYVISNVLPYSIDSDKPYEQGATSLFKPLNIEMQSPKTTLNSVGLDNQLRRRSASF